MTMHVIFFFLNGGIILKMGKSFIIHYNINLTCDTNPKCHSNKPGKHLVAENEC